MELNMADILLGGVPFDYKLSSIILQLKDGGVEIGPPRPNTAKDGEEEEDGVANLVLEVYNENAEEVEIEYQPQSEQGDPRWGFSCDGHTLKTVVPYEFWKKYWIRELDEQHKFLHDVIRRAGPAPSCTQAICGLDECSNTLQAANNPVAMAGVHICHCHFSNDRSKRQVSTVLRHPNGLGQGHLCSTHANSDAMRVIKVRCQRPPGSPASFEGFEREIKVRCSRPVSPTQVSETEARVRNSRPVSPIQVSDSETKARYSKPDSPTPDQISESASKTRMRYSRSESPTPTQVPETATRTVPRLSRPESPTPAEVSGTATREEATTRTTSRSSRAESLTPAQVSETATPTRPRYSRPESPTPTQVSETATKTRPLSSTDTSERSVELSYLALSSTADTLARVRQISEGLPGSGCTTPCLLSDALARAKDISDSVARRPGSSTDGSEGLTMTGSGCSTPYLPAEALPRAKDALARVNGTRAGELRPRSSTPKRRVNSRSTLNTEASVRARAAATSPMHPNPPEPKKSISLDTSDLMTSFSGDTSDLVDTLSRQSSNLDLGRPNNSVLVGKTIVKDAQKLETIDIWREAIDRFINKEKASIIKGGKRSKEFLKEVLEFISKEKTILVEQGKRYIAAKRKEFTLTKLECIFCLRVVPAVEDPDGIMTWNSFNEYKNWKAASIENRIHNYDHYACDAGCQFSTAF